MMATYTLLDTHPAPSALGPVAQYLPGPHLGTHETAGPMLVMFSSLGIWGAPVYRMVDAPRTFIDSMEPPGEFLGWYYAGRIESKKRKPRGEKAAR